MEKFACFSCGNLFQPTKKRRKYCSRACSGRYVRVLRPRKPRALVQWECNIKWRYGLTPEALTEALVKQGGLCKLCGKPPGEKFIERFVIDHDAVTGRFRGIIHRKENSSLGVFGDDAAGLLRAVAYVRGEL